MASIDNSVSGGLIGVGGEVNLNFGRRITGRNLLCLQCGGDRILKQTNKNTAGFGFLTKDCGSGGESKYKRCSD
jgi:hypothetical protein